MKDIEIQLPSFEIEDLIEIQAVTKAPVVQEDQGWQIIPSNASLNRAIYWINKTDCANITAWRSGNKRAINDANNRELQETLRTMGYGVIKLQGFYAEVGQDVSKENSFLVFDQNDDPNFYENLRMLSEKFDQDCFLYKAAGNLSAKAYSEIGSGRISFE